MNELEAQVARRKSELIAEIKDHKQNSCRAGAADEVARISAHLAELALLVKHPYAEARLGQWLQR